MKEITAYGDQYGKWYEVKGDDGYYNAFRSYQGTTEYYNKYYCSIFEESEEERIARLAREKAIERDKKIDSILG